MTVGWRIGHGGRCGKYHSSGGRQERLDLIPSAQPVRELCMPAQGSLKASPMILPTCTASFRVQATASCKAPRTMCAPRCCSRGCHSKAYMQSRSSRSGAIVRAASSSRIADSSCTQTAAPSVHGRAMLCVRMNSMR